jgi:hypothetical protein
MRLFPVCNDTLEHIYEQFYDAQLSTVIAGGLQLHARYCCECATYTVRDVQWNML